MNFDNAMAAAAAGRKVQRPTEDSREDWPAGAYVASDESAFGRFKHLPAESEHVDGDVLVRTTYEPSVSDLAADDWRLVE